MIRRPPRSTQSRSSAASDVYKRQGGLRGLPLGLNVVHEAAQSPELQLVDFGAQIVLVNPAAQVDRTLQALQLGGCTPRCWHSQHLRHRAGARVQVVSPHVDKGAADALTACAVSY